ncbi:hypothetical protein [Paenibacillus agilis]|uniref:Uncharacterized protein n=1 Tax=Paenibacillus agilis TaxID=3020863 RepID=A0A559J1M2_9BACL|nr:hypothetical protein [Paenibacillus agilis]TVX93785.1 hypothetical protein FPZ44_12400 [Paenibacillus agilis]
MSRFKDPRLHIDDFVNNLLVACPSCNKCATVITEFQEVSTATDSCLRRLFICNHCGKIDEAMNEYQLWLKANCKGNILWAYNLKHLEYIENYVQAKLRESSRHEKLGWCNQGLFSRLPVWIKEKRNRNIILMTIKKLKKTINVGKRE